MKSHRIASLDLFHLIQSKTPQLLSHGYVQKTQIKMSCLIATTNKLYHIAKAITYDHIQVCILKLHQTK